MTEIEKKAKKLVELLITYKLPENEITLVLMGMFKALHYPYASVDNKRIFALFSEDILNFLEKNNIITVHKKISASNSYPISPTKFIVSYNQKRAEIFLAKFKNKSIVWCISNKEKHEYQVGEGIIKQTGKIREKIFIALMNEYNHNPEHKIVIQTLSQLTKMASDRVRIEISFINEKLRSKSQLELVGSGNGYYTLEKISSN